MTLTYSGNLVRQHDPDRFLLSVLMPAEHHKALWALFAFNYEIAKTREVVTETTIGHIRLQWWRDAIAEIYEGQEVRKHEVLDDLVVAIKDYDLPRELFDKLIYTREFDLEGVAPANLDGLNLYLDGTCTALHHLAVIIVSEADNETVISEISQYYGMVGLLRSLPFMLSYGHVMLPQDVLEQHNLSEKKICDFNSQKELIEVTKELLNQDIEYHKPNSRFLRGVRTVAKIHARRIKVVQYDVFHPKLQIPPRFMALRVWFTTSTNFN